MGFESPPKLHNASNIAARNIMLNLPYPPWLEFNTTKRMADDIGCGYDIEPDGERLRGFDIPTHTFGDIDDIRNIPHSERKFIP